MSKRLFIVCCLLSLFCSPAFPQLPEGLELEVEQARRVVTSEDGNFLVIQTLRDEIGEITGQSAQLYDSELSTIGEPFLLPELPSCSSFASEIGLTATNLYLFWPELAPGEAETTNCTDFPAPPVTNLFGRRYTRRGEPLGISFPINTSALGSQIYAAFSPLPTGGFAVTWSDLTAELNGVGDYISHQLVRRFDADGAPREAVIRVSELAMFDPVSHGALLPLENGGITVAWSYLNANGIPETSVRTFDSMGQPVMGQVRLDGTGDYALGGPDMAFMEDGSIVVVAAGSFVASRRLSQEGMPLGSPVFIPFPDRDGHHSYDYRDAHVLPGSGNEYLVGWSWDAFSEVPGPVDTDSSGVFGRWMELDGDPKGDVFQINARFRGHQSLTALGRSENDEPRAFFLGPSGLLMRKLRTACTPGPTTLCLGEGGRFRVEVAWADFQDGDGQAGGEELSQESGYFWFFRQENVELVVKVIDGGAVNDSFWVFYGALSNVAYQLTVTDTQSGIQKVYRNPAGNFASVGDTVAFPNAEIDQSESGSSGSLSIDPSRVAALLPEISADSRSSVVSEAASGTENALEFENGRFAASLNWETRSGEVGEGHGVPLTSDTGYFWFFSPDRAEVVVKVLDGRDINGHYWVFYGALSNVEYTLSIEDRQLGTTRTYFNPAGEFSSAGDTEALDQGSPAVH